MGDVTPFERRRAADPAPARDLAAARRLVRAGRWTDARAQLADDRSPSAEALELRGSLAYLLGDSRGCFEDLAASYRSQDRADHAARCAAWLGILHLIRGEAGHSRGWFTTAKRLVDEHGECAASAYLRVLPILDDQTSGREEAIRTAREVHAIARRYDDIDAVALTGQTLGQLLIRTGRADEGRDLMDEAMVAAVSGQLSSPLVEVLVLLAVMESCQLLADLDRSREWAATVARLRSGYAELAVFLGVFALDQARIAWLSGDWDLALAALDDVDAPLQGEAWRIRGDVHRSRGRYDDARAAYEHASDAAAGRALLEHATGRPAMAAAEVRRALATAVDACDRARLLPAAVRVLADEAPDEAATLAQELVAIGELFSSRLLRARGRLALAEVALASGRADAAADEARHAVAACTDLVVPAELARAHELAAAAERARGNAEGAVLEQSSADRIAARLGLAPSSALPAAPEAPVSSRELDVLRLLAGGATNREIATALILSPRTVDRHVSNIFAKIGVTTRAAAAAYAVEHGWA
jgi:DNA-binding NarL/FixJ family response regulator